MRILYEIGGQIQLRTFEGLWLESWKGSDENPKSFKENPGSILLNEYPGTFLMWKLLRF